MLQWRMLGDTHASCQTLPGRKERTLILIFSVKSLSLNFFLPICAVKWFESCYDAWKNVCVYWRLHLKGSWFTQFFFSSNSTVPPSIEHEGTLVDTKVKEKHNITLTCEVSGKSLRNKTYLCKKITVWMNFYFIIFDRQVTPCPTLNGRRTDTSWWLTGATKCYLTAVSSKSPAPRLQTLAGTPAWRPTAQATAVGTSTSTSWVRTRQIAPLPLRLMSKLNQY